MNKYRIYVAGCTKLELFEYCLQNIKSCSIQDQMGVWNGKGEYSFVIEILNKESFLIPVMAICMELKDKFKQEAVLYTVEQVRGELC